MCVYSDCGTFVCIFCLASQNQCDTQAADPASPVFSQLSRSAGPCVCINLQLPYGTEVCTVPEVSKHPITAPILKFTAPSISQSRNKLIAIFLKMIYTNRKHPTSFSLTLTAVWSIMHIFCEMLQHKANLKESQTVSDVVWVISASGPTLERQANPYHQQLRL